MHRSRLNPFIAKIATNAKAKKHKNKPDQTEKMERLRGEATHEHQRYEIQEPTDQARNAVLRDSVNTGTVRDRHFGNAEALPLGHHRDKAVVIAVKLDETNNGTAVRLDAAVKIVQTLAADDGNRQIEQLGG